ncbi:MAG: GtrA family protein [Clostridiales bacterium]|nr:GtrA family protein [Clostridiales bacterium]
MKEFFRKLFDWSFFRFAIVGGVNTLLGMAIMFGLYNLAHCSYWLSSAANYVITSIISFFLNKYFTFRSRTDTPRQALRFALNIAVCYLIAYGLAKPLTLRLLSGVSVTARDNVAMLVGMVLFSLLNYLGQRVLVFKKD